MLLEEKDFGFKSSPSLRLRADTASDKALTYITDLLHQILPLCSLHYEDSSHIYPGMIVLKQADYETSPLDYLSVIGHLWG